VTAPARPIPTLPGPYSVDEAITRLINIQASQVGYHEGRSGGDWTNDNAFGQWYGSNGVAWCAQFQSWAASQAGYLDVIIPKHQYTPAGYNWFKSRGREVGLPKRGDLLYVYGKVRGEKNPRVHHVGMVEQVLPGGYIRTLEGNTNTGGSAQGDGVYRLQRQVTSRLRFVRPDYTKVVKPRPPGKKPPGKSVMPRTGGHPKKDSKGAEILDLRILVLATKVPVATHMTWAQRAAVCGSFKHPKIGCMPPAEEVTRESFKAAWKRWQQKLGYKGADADGIPGTASFSRLIEKTGRSKKSPGYRAP
jgi:CHAP domain-containing protein